MSKPDHLSTVAYSPHPPCIPEQRVTDSHRQDLTQGQSKDAPSRHQGHRVGSTSDWSCEANSCQSISG